MQLTSTTWVVGCWSKTREVAFPQCKPLPKSTANSAVSNSTFKQAALTFFQIPTYSKLKVFLQSQSMLCNLCVSYRATERRKTSLIVNKKLADFDTNTSCFILWKEIIAAYRQKSMLHIDTFYEQNWKLRNFKAGSAYCYPVHYSFNVCFELKPYVTMTPFTKATLYTFKVTLQLEWAKF
jgi:hypothetical protein